MSWTLLDYTQAILSSLDSDEVNSIGDTTESQQVVKVIRATWEEIVARADLSEHYSLYELEASTDDVKPVKMFRPSFAYSTEWIKYNVRGVNDPADNFRMIQYLPLDIYLSRTNTLSEDESNIGTFTEIVKTSSITFKYTKNSPPSYWTTHDDHSIIFNSYDIAVDDTLQKTKTQCYGKTRQDWLEEDTFVPFIDSEFCVLLLNEAKSLAFAELKQMAHAKAENSARRLWSDTQKKKRSLDRNRSELDRLPNYARLR